jgi:hypothetical protein
MYLYYTFIMQWPYFYVVSYFIVFCVKNFVYIILYIPEYFRGKLIVWLVKGLDFTDIFTTKDI